MHSSTLLGKLLALAILVLAMTALSWPSSATEPGGLSTGPTKRRLCTPETLDQCLNGVGGGLEWLHTGGRKDFQDDTVTLTARIPL